MEWFSLPPSLFLQLVYQFFDLFRFPVLLDLTYGFWLRDCILSLSYAPLGPSSPPVSVYLRSSPTYSIIVGNLIPTVGFILRRSRELGSLPLCARSQWGVQEGQGLARYRNIDEYFFLLSSSTAEFLFRDM
jgi:hypothetical protein